MKSKNKIQFFSIFTILFLIGYYFILTPLFLKSNKNIENEIAAHIVYSDSLVKAFETDEEKSNQLYVGKIIEIFGTVKEITFLNDRITVILEKNSDNFGVICDINPSQKNKIKLLKKDQKIRVKGICKGFLKDVIILNCSINLITNE